MNIIQSFIEKYSKMMNSVHSENYTLPVVVVRIFQTMSSTNVIRSQNARAVQFLVTTIISVAFVLHKRRQSYPPTYNPSYCRFSEAFWNLQSILWKHYVEDIKDVAFVSRLI